MYEENKRKLQESHQIEFDLIEYCIELVILDAKHNQGIVDRWWEEQSDMLFKYSRYLSEVGINYDVGTVFETEYNLCAYN